VQQPPLDDGGVPDELRALPRQRVQPAQGVVPVVVGEGAVKGRVEQRVRGLERGGIEIGGVRRMHVSHAGRSRT